MKLFVITQKVDSTDPILGFFNAWLEEFASSVEHVTVVAQSVGTHMLPKNVTVVSLGKDSGTPTYRQVFRFWKEIIRHASSYDRVFVHMTPIWIVLGAPVWVLLRKPMYLWYEIKRGSIKLSIALLFVRKVFAASEHGLPSVVKKQVIVGHGIDTDAFAIDAAVREKNHIVALGRVTTIKHYEVIIRAFAKLPACRLTIAGGTITEEDKQTEHSLRDLIHRLGIADRVEMGWVSPVDVPQLLQRADCMLHASQGGLDKAVLQAMSCGCPVMSTSEAAWSVLPADMQVKDNTMADQVQKILALSDAKRLSLSTTLRSIVVRDHSLTQCIKRLISEMS